MTAVSLSSGGDTRGAAARSRLFRSGAGGIVHRFHNFKYGLSLVLVLVGTKRLVNAAFDAKMLPTELALLLTALLIGGSMLISVIKTRPLPKEVTGAEVIHG